MKLSLRFVATLYKTKTNVIEPKNAGEQPVTWYQAIIDQSDSVCTVTCSEIVTKKARFGHDYEFIAEYDTEGKRFKVVDVEDIGGRPIVLPESNTPAAPSAQAAPKDAPKK